METRRSLSLVNGACLAMVMLIFGQVVVAQRVPEFDGEMSVEIKNGSVTTITADASGGTVCGSRQSWYPVTHDYDYRSKTALHLYLDHLDSADPP